jgi:hypothetical protein
MDEFGNTREDLKLPSETEKDEETTQRIKNGIDNQANIYVTVLNSMNIEKVIEAAEKNN